MNEVITTGSGDRTVKRIRSLKGAFRPPGDQYISHLGLIVGALAEGETIISGLAPGQNVRCTIDCLRDLGVEIREGPGLDSVTVVGTGACGGGPGLATPAKALDCGSSATTVELMAGLLTGQGMDATLVGDNNLSRRPMERIAEPLKVMGAEIGLSEEGTLPMVIKGRRLSGITYENPTGSAVVKSSVLLAGLGASDPVEYNEPVRTWDHTERLLKGFGAKLETRTSGGGHGEYSVRLESGSPLFGREIKVPGDISAALYLVIAALLLPKSDLILKDVGLNPGRKEAIKVLVRMGGKIEISNRHMVGAESWCDLHIRRSKLKGTGISGRSVAWLMDEIPAVVVAAAFAEGESYIKDIEEMRNMEIDRISAMVQNLKVLGLEVGEYPDGLIFRGKPVHDGGEFDSFGDYRIALAFHAAALACHGESTIHGYDVTIDYWPDFAEVIEALKI